MGARFIINSKYVRVLRAISMILVLAIFMFTSNVRALAATCPSGMSDLDCASLYGGWTSWVPDNGSSSCGVTTDETGGGIADAQLQLTNSQLSIVKTIIGIAKTENLGQAGAIIGLMVGEDESHFKIYANSNVPTSLTIPHQAVGSDHASVGVFQQQIGYDWTTLRPDSADNQAAVAQLMDPAYAAEAFFGSPKGANAPPALSKGLQNQSGWQTMDPWVVAQAVQQSGDPTGSNYKAFLSDAQQLIAKYYDSSPAVPLPVSFTGAGTGSPGDTASACAASGVVAGSIVQTALGLAWPEAGHGKEKADATAAYQTAMPNVEGGDPGNDAWSDCGVFVATVMRSSGADPDYPLRTTTVQQPTLEKESTKYKDLGVLSNSAEVQPGDIFIGGGHTFIYIGPQTGAKYGGRSVAEGSWHDHVPEVDHVLADYGGNGQDYNNFGAGTMTTFRLINQGS